MLIKKNIEIQQDMASIIDKGRLVGLKSEMIAHNIFTNAVVDRDIVVVEDRGERPLSLHEISIILRKALKQAEFGGGVIILPSGEIIRSTGNYRSGDYCLKK